jgi:hypothetical protein
VIAGMQAELAEGILKDASNYLEMKIRKARGKAF